MKTYGYYINGKLIDKVKAADYMDALIKLDTLGYNMARGDVIKIKQ